MGWMGLGGLEAVWGLEWGDVLVHAPVWCAMGRRSGWEEAREAASQPEHI